MSKGARIRARHAAEKSKRGKGKGRQEQSATHVPPRMFSRRPRGIKATADPTPRPEATQKILNVLAVWRRPKRADGSRIPHGKNARRIADGG